MKENWDFLGEVKVSDETLKDIQKIENPRTKDLFLSDEDFNKLRDSEYDLDEEKDSVKKRITEAYEGIIHLLREYSDLKEEYYNIIALWIIGTYFHSNFPTYPYLYLNAMRGSGKSRTMRLITTLSYDGNMLNSLTEAVLFRSRGTLGIDEFEGVVKKGVDNLRELLNSCYKRGTKVVRMRRVRTNTGEDFVKEEFDVYRPIVIANISGMESVLNDRCITLILEKSNNRKITNLIETFEWDPLVTKIKESLMLLLKSNKCRLCSVGTLFKTYTEWNNLIKNTYTTYTQHTNNTNYTNYTEALKTINSMDLGGRDIELGLPICLIAAEISEKVLKETIQTYTTITNEKREEEFTENRDISLIDFISQYPENQGFISISRLTKEFLEFLQTNDDEINSVWIGRALKRLKLIIEKRRLNRGVEIKLNIKKAQEKVLMFK